MCVSISFPLWGDNDSNMKIEHIVDAFNPMLIWMMNIKTIRFKETDSTSRYLREYVPAEGEDVTIAVADFSDGRAGDGHQYLGEWTEQESAVQYFGSSRHVAGEQTVLLSWRGCGLTGTLSGYTDGITIKWPNDILLRIRKSAVRESILLSSHGIKNFILGTGMNVNQREFHSDAPNPVSLRQILSHDVDRDELLNRVTDSFMKYYGMIVGGDYGYCGIVSPVTLSCPRISSIQRCRWRLRGRHLGSGGKRTSDIGDREGMIRSYEFKDKI